jgi:broad specificity phosphatase PhoE
MNEIGETQAKFSGKYLNDYRQKETKFDLILCSPMIRTRETAKLIANEIDYDYNNIVYMNELVELDHGHISIGETREVMKQNPYYDNFFNTMYEIFGPYLGKYDYLQSNIDDFYLFDKNIDPKYEHETLSHLIKRCSKVVEYIKNSNKKKF